MVQLPWMKCVIQSGEVTILGQPQTNPNTKLSLTDARSNGGIIKVSNKRLILSPDQQIKTRVWVCHKLKGEIVSEHDPVGRLSLLE